MRLEKYESKANKNQTIFTFISEGHKGNILKSVRFTKIKIKGIKNIYNLGFGDVNKVSGDIDDLIVTNNQDSEKVLATVANTVVTFTNYYPKSLIFFKGSTRSRTRLYQMAIGKYFEELSKVFDIEGFTEDELLPFEKNINYDAFLISRKIM